MASLKEQENLLFSKWNEPIVRDGIVCEEGYSKSRKKLLFLLKEANSKELNWCLANYIGQKEVKKQTWNNLYRWIRGLKEPQHNWSWDELKKVDINERQKEFQQIAVMNLKKIPGSYVLDRKSFFKYVTDNRDNLYRQLDLYDANYIICCGSDVVRGLEIVLSGQIKWRKTRNGVNYASYNNSVIIHFCHPEARIADNFMFFILVDAIREIESLPGVSL